MRWRRFIVALGYWRATAFPLFFVLPLVTITYWILLFSVLPGVFGSKFHIAPSKLVFGPASVIWILPSVLGSFLAWPLALMGVVSAEEDDKERAGQASGRQQEAEQASAGNHGRTR